VIVKDIDVSVTWYKSIFGLTVKNESNDAGPDTKLLLWSLKKLLVELIELRGSLSREALLAVKPDGTQIQGHFKVGFKVKDIDACLKRFAQLQIEVPRVWKEHRSGKRNFIVSDPDGNLIQFFD
jgi:catechol 2,3-dioxygenase-like lactoylglutathione lyase family enzyme